MPADILRAPRLRGNVAKVMWQITLSRVRHALGHVRRYLERTTRRPIERCGYNLTRRNFESPLPDVSALPQGLWDGPSNVPGVDLRVEDAVDLVHGPLLPYLSEFRPPLHPDEPGRFWLCNGYYESVDAEILYAMLRHLKPSRVYELGSGASSHVIHMAGLANAQDDKPFEQTIFDPFPFQTAAMGPVPGATVHAARTEDLNPARFSALQTGDVLFIDTTHTVRTGGDVTHIFLEVLPRIAPGVTIHVHDIFLPYEYPRDWVIGLRRAWAEQYLLQAFLAFNDEFEVVMPNYAIARAAPARLKQAIPSFDPETVRQPPGGFWIRSRDAA